MATATRDITFSKNAYVKRKSPNTHYSISAGTSYIVSRNIDDSSDDNLLLFGGANSWPSSLKRKRIIQAKVHVYLKFGTGTCVIRGCKDFAASSVTYNKMPADTDIDGSTTAAEASTSVGSWKNVWVTMDDLGASYRAEAAISILQNGAVYIEGDSYSSWAPELFTPWYAKTVLSDDSKPVVRIYYDDAVDITSKVVIGTKLSGTVNPEKAQTVTWSLKKNSSYYCYNEVWTQSSAKFYWKVSGASSWNTINISGSTMKVTIPAFTFPTGKTIQYYVQATDNDGTTTSTSTYSFTTPASKITPQNCPTSGYLNPRNPVKFSWYFAHTNGDYPQQSAKLCWKVSGASSWNEVPASGTTQNLTIPAYPEEGSFPIASTIEWYLYGVDSSGSASQTLTYTISTTAATAYATANSPDSSVEDGSAPITFKWTLTSADGYAISRVILQWKLPSANSWTTLMDENEAVSEWTASAGTFPAGEVQWHVQAYNIDGVAGPLSDTSFICVDAPDPVQGLRATDVPISTISWQSDGQEAYEISIDGEVVQKAFGVGVYSWTVPEPLSDGEHIITVRIQGIYGLWSQPSETSIFVENVPQYDLMIRGEFDYDARLTVSLGSEEGEDDEE